MTFNTASPWWNPYAKGGLFGLSRGSSRAQIMRAVLESMVFQNTTLLKSMEQASKIKIKKIAADGGATQSDLLMQLQTDSAKVPVLRPKMVYITARGAAKAALKGFGRLTPSLANKERKKFTPSQASPQVVKQYSRWYRSAEFIDRFYR